MKELRYILLTMLFLVYVSQPVLANSFNTTTEMTCCEDSKMETEEHNMPCCEDTSSIDNCNMDSCSCTIGIAITAFTLNIYKEIFSIDQIIKHRFPSLIDNLQTPFFPIWCPPDIA